MSGLRDRSELRPPERPDEFDPDVRTRSELPGPGAARIESVRALTARAYELERGSTRREALALFRRVIVEFGQAREPEIREEVAFALLRTGLVLCFVHRRAEAIGALGALLKSFKRGETKGIDEYLELANDRHQKLIYGSS